MAADAVGPDPVTLWREQEPEADSVTLERIHVLVRRYDRKQQFGVGAMAAILLLTGLLSGELWVNAHDLVTRLSAALLVVGEVGVCALAYRRTFPTRDAAEPAGAFLRRRLRTSLVYAQGRWLIVVTPIMPFMLLNIYVQFTRAPGPLWARVATLIVFAVALLVAWRTTQARIPRIKAELDELDRLLQG